MAVSDAAFEAMDNALFDVFGEPCTVTRDGTSKDLLCVITPNVERIGEYGQTTGRVMSAQFKNSDWQPKPGDVLAIQGRYNTTKKVESVLGDDGFVAEVILYG